MPPVPPPSAASRPTLVPGALLALSVLAFLQLAAPATAHVGGTGGEVTEFTMPMWVVYLAGALVVALSFALVGAYLSRDDEQKRLYKTPPPQHSPAPHTRWTPLRMLGLLVLALVVANALAPGPSRFPSVIYWLVIWVILPLVAYTLGDPWPRISPFAPLEPLAARLRSGHPPKTYPERLGMWPAVVLLVTLIALEVGEFPWTQQADPLAILTLAYFLLTFLGMARYGKDWLQHAEVIGRMLAWWAAVSPLHWEGRRPHWRGLTGLQALPAYRLDAVAFTIAILYGVNHDVFLHTPNGQAALTHLETWGIPLASVALMIIGLLVFLGAWMFAARLMRDHGETLHTVRTTAAVFVASLLPIAAAYHLAHNLPYLWQNLPVLLTALSDPLGLGWGPHALALPATLAFPARLLAPLAATQILLIILGHLIAVLVAHRLAFGNHPSRVQAVRAEIPLTLAMVLYTGIGLALLGAKGGAVA